VLVKVTRFGPYPDSIQRPQGPFLLVISNASGAPVETFSLILKPAGTATAAAASVSLLDLHSTLQKQHDSAVIAPLPGAYQIVFQSHPNWHVDLTVTAQ
jgi:hypothetical protein